jgi:hypothetical protein
MLQGQNLQLVIVCRLLAIDSYGKAEVFPIRVFSVSLPIEEFEAGSPPSNLTEGLDLVNLLRKRVPVPGRVETWAKSQ